jgi:hypothetical protein
MQTTNTTFDVDLAVHFGSEVRLESGQPNGVPADYRVITESGDERLVITNSCTPPLQPGTYYIVFLVFYRNFPSISGQITATVAGSAAPPSITTAASLPPTVAGASYSQALAASGGTPPYS